LGWQRDPELWTVRCHDRYGRRALVQVHLTEIGLRIISSSPEPLELTPPEVGRLRAALRDGVLSLGELAGPDGFCGADRPPRSIPPPQRSASTRERVTLRRLPPRPTVAEIATRLAQHDIPKQGDGDQHRRATEVAA
ncbi:MAG: hypothetical protein M3291_09345, partial [Actinomycetota bacterium]|nr:hypothetical protein [Actinomycetota bacterium]